MSRFLGKFTLLIGAMLMLASCDSTEKIGSPLVAPQLSLHAGPTLVEGALKGTPQKVSGVVDEKGGWVALTGNGKNGDVASHLLWVTPGAVDRPTVFTITIVSNKYVMVDLTAEQEIDGKRVNIGHNGFAKPVLLALSYANATVRPAKRLSVVYVTDTGDFVELPGGVNAGAKVVYANLAHFSRYAICAD